VHLRLFAAILLALVSAGCQDENKAANLPRPVDDWQPDQPITERTVYVAPDREGERFTVAQESTDRPAVYTVDAMVGQINGRPLYASTVFDEIGQETIRTIAASKPKAEFVREIYALLNATLGQKITDALLLAEAQASLNEQEQRGLLDLLRKYREDLISQAGGSLALAEAAVREDRGMSLDEAVEQRRQQILVSKYLQDKLYPRIHVTRYDVERFYEENYDTFNPKPEVTVQFLVARDPRDAQAVDEALAAGTSFKEVGEMRGVRLSEITHSGTIETFDGVAFEQANEAARRLNEGEHSPRIKVAIGSVWVRVAKVQTGESKALPDVYLAIEKRLRAQRFDQLNRKYLSELLKKGNYTPIDQMLDALVEVAVNRYAMGK
jgi:hypothetical protein